MIRGIPAAASNLKPISKLRVAAAQMKFRDLPAENLDWIGEVAHRKAREGVDAILFPECAVTGYNRDFDGLSRATATARRALEFLSQTARRARCHLLVGCPTFTGARLFNSLVVFDRRGRETFRYSKIHLTARDRRFFAPGNSIAFFHLDRVPCTAIICHERRFPELVRLPVMLGAQILFHPNAGLDSLPVSKAKRKGRDGIVARAFENEIFYVFANSVGPQGDGLWSAGDSKIVGPDSRILALANNRDARVIDAELDLTKAGRQYAREALVQPAFLRAHWRSLLAACRRQLRKSKTT
ncbi:MAG: carbon-nitrogen hydrolase family protein [Verrucomicrobia bacterium]|nr:carbon-nitrogen hydrolase family protein [Verrucomicrobiota bacterium]